MTEPSVDTIEALVRSIQARESSPAAVSTRTVPPRSLVVAAGPTVERRAPAPPVATTPVTWVERRPGPRPALPPRPGRLADRLEWDRLVASEGERGQRYGRSATVVLVAVSPRDRHDPEVDRASLGRAMTPCGTALLRITRAADPVGILGDRHFGVLLREADSEAAERYASRAIAACDPWLAASARPMRLVVASTPIRAGSDIAATVRDAERRLRLPVSPGGRSG